MFCLYLFHNKKYLLTRTPLHWAAAMGQLGCVRALLRLGVVPDPRDVDNVSPLEYAKCAGHNGKHLIGVRCWFGLVGIGFTCSLIWVGLVLFFIIVLFH